MNKMNRNDYIMCLEDTLPYVTKKQFVAAFQPQSITVIEDLLRMPIRDIPDDVLKNVWSKVKPIL